MLVANSFDLWQKDVFFSAAEEVQQSADIMESAYRRWLSARREGMMPQHLDELVRHLQMALGTAKWQLDEFEKAVQMSYRGHGDEFTVSRHSQFVSAIEEQISEVETALKEAFDLAGEKPFRWVHLDEQECDDLALFLSGTSGTSQQATDEGVSCRTSFHQKKNTEEDNNLYSEVWSKIQIPDQGKCLEVVTRNEETKCLIDQEEGRFPETGIKISHEADRNANDHRPWNSPDMYLEIVIDKDDRQKNASIEATPKEKGTKPCFWSLRGDEHTRVKGVPNHNQMKVIHWINQLLKGHRNQRQQHVSPVLPVKSIRFILVLMLTVFLVVPFLVYST